MSGAARGPGGALRVRPSDWIEAPWRNGGGVTSEIVAAREGGAILWRLSTAVVARDGDYSTFPGLTRVSAVIEGAGIALRDPLTGARLAVPPLTPMALPCETPLRGTLAGGPIRHLNLIFDPARASGTLTILRLEGERALPAGTRGAFCVSGACEAVDGPTGSAEPHDLLWNLPPRTRLRGRAVLVSIGLVSSPSAPSWLV